MYKIKILCITLFLSIPRLYAQDFPEIKGWQISSEVLKYNSENLWEYINGAADQFIDYGFELLLAAELSNDLLQVSVEIYDMGLPLNAFGIYMTERPQQANIFKIGTESSISLPAQCLLLKDRYYVKIHVYKGELNLDNGKELIDALAIALPGQSLFPNEFALLPDTGQIKGSFGHVRRNFLGLSELSNCVFANYLNDESKEYQYFAVIPEPENSIEIIWDIIRDKWKSAELDGQQIYLRKIPYQGFIGVIKMGSNLLGAANISSEDVLVNRLKILSK
jgi:hypothetical protein